jgi:asparagine synthase (glutamine-hydrolysing)
MSVQFGRWNFEGQAAAPDYIAKISAMLAPYGPDSDESYSKGGLNILYRAFHTTKESRREIQPTISSSGAVITWDGRLDNRVDLVRDLQNALTIDSADVAIVAAAYERWNSRCFAKFIGDWALSIFDPIDRSLILAKDPTGVRHLYYAIDDNQVTWSTILDPLVLCAGRKYAICEEYIAGWLATAVFPAAHLTPYIGILAVPPSSFVLLRPGKQTVNKYWDFDPAKQIRYSADAQYEEHFRTVFAEAIRRRLRSDRPVLAELSGGMDSSSIVCMADTIIARGDADVPRLDTISWYDDSYDHIEPDWNESPYFTIVEEKRGRAGFHINIGTPKHGIEGRAGLQNSLNSKFDRVHFAATPSSNGDVPNALKQYAACMLSQGNRVVLSGIAGDEPTGGGVPTPKPELQNLLTRGRLFTLARRLKAWSTRMRRSSAPLLCDAIGEFFPHALTCRHEAMRRAPWLDTGFTRRNHATFCGYPLRVKLFGPLPSFQDQMDKLDANRRFQEHFILRPELLCDRRLPYLDRDFLEFMFAIPREQIVGVGQRRFLMKRALVGIVPEELRNRRRKAFVPQERIKDPLTEWPNSDEISKHIVSSSIGLVDSIRFTEALQKARRNEDVPIDLLRRALTLEAWLRHLLSREVLNTQQPQQKSVAQYLPELRRSRVNVQPTNSAS